MRLVLESASPPSAELRGRVVRPGSAYAKPPVAVRVVRLRSDLFHRDSRLEAALTTDARHITRGAAGSHVGKIQSALILLLDPPPLITRYDVYDAATAAAVLRYKTKRAIINFAYQTSPDDIVGKMTMRSLDNEMAAFESAVGSALLGILTRLDELLSLYQASLSPELRGRCENIRRQAVSLAAPGDFRKPAGRLGYAYNRGLRYMNELATSYRRTVVATSYRRPVVGVAIAPAIVGVALAAFLLLIAAVIAIILVSEILKEADRLGQRVNNAIDEALDAGERAVLENVGEIDELDQAVEHCRRISQNRSPACLDALARFATKKVEVVAKRAELQGILQNLRNALKGSPNKFIWKLLARRAEAAGKALAGLMRELRDIARDIIRECGCAFIRI